MGVGWGLLISLGLSNLMLIHHVIAVSWDPRSIYFWNSKDFFFFSDVAFLPWRNRCYKVQSPNGIRDLETANTRGKHINKYFTILEGKWLVDNCTASKWQSWGLIQNLELQPFCWGSPNQDIWQSKNPRESQVIHRLVCGVWTQDI